jgi:hypothetical protein
LAEVTGEEMLEKIRVRCLELINEDLIPGKTSYTQTARAKTAGEALQALALGIKEYKDAVRMAHVIKV